MAEPPGLEDLSEKVGLSLKKLKMGFKQIYGDTVYGFLFDYKMDYARQLLDSGSYNVNEVGLKIGYMHIFLPYLLQPSNLGYAYLLCEHLLLTLKTIKAIKTIKNIKTQKPKKPNSEP